MNKNYHNFKKVLELVLSTTYEARIQTQHWI